MRWEIHAQSGRTLFLNTLRQAQWCSIYLFESNSKGPLMATNMLHDIKHNIKHITVVQSNTQLEMHIFGQVTFDAVEIYNAKFEIVPYSNNSLTEKHVYDHSDAKSLKTVCNRDHDLYCLVSV